MSRWFLDRRQEFILATLRQFGQIRRQDIAREFGVTIQVASADIQSFMADREGHVRYDLSAKCYVVIDEAEKQSLDRSAALKLAIDHIEHMAKWIATQKAGYSFEGLGEDLPSIRAALSDGAAV